MLDEFAGALGDMRRAMLAGKQDGVRRASERLDRAADRADQLDDPDSVALLRSCPRA